MTGKVTLAELRSECARVYGPRFKAVGDMGVFAGNSYLTVGFTDGAAIDFMAKTRMGARRLALETLRRMGAG